MYWSGALFLRRRVFIISVGVQVSAPRVCHMRADMEHSRLATR